MSTCDIVWVAPSRNGYRTHAWDGHTRMSYPDRRTWPIVTLCGAVLPQRPRLTSAQVVYQHLCPHCVAAVGIERV